MDSSDFLTCDKCSYEICTATQSTGYESGILCCSKGHTFCKECYPEVFEKFKEMHENFNIKLEASNDYFGYDPELPPINEITFDEMAEFFAEHPGKIDQICPLCKEDPIPLHEFLESIKDLVERFEISNGNSIVGLLVEYEKELYEWDGQGFDLHIGKQMAMEPRTEE